MTCNRVKFWAWISISGLFTYMCVPQDIQKSSWGGGGGQDKSTLGRLPIQCSESSVLVSHHDCQHLPQSQG